MNSRQRDNDRKPMVVSLITVTSMCGYQVDGPMYMYLGQVGVVPSIGANARLFHPLKKQGLRWWW